MAKFKIVLEDDNGVDHSAGDIYDLTEEQADTILAKVVDFTHDDPYIDDFDQTNDLDGGPILRPSNPPR